MNVIYEGEGKLFPVVIELSLEEAKVLLQILEDYARDKYKGSPSGCGDSLESFLCTLASNLRELTAFTKEDLPHY